MLGRGVSAAEAVVESRRRRTAKGRAVMEGLRRGRRGEGETGEVESTAKLPR
jgi:hypothetical protein